MVDDAAHRDPTQEGRQRWPPDGCLQLRGGEVACTCTAACLDPDCKGACGCEACALGWLIHQDEQALWDENGELVDVVELRPDAPGVVDPRLLRLRFSS
ncbi:MAG: hypothetical protein ACYC0F_07265 [Rhodanobacter sp.]